MVVWPLGNRRVCVCECSCRTTCAWHVLVWFVWSWCFGLRGCCAFNIAIRCKGGACRQSGGLSLQTQSCRLCANLTAECKGLGSCPYVPCKRGLRGLLLLLRVDMCARQACGVATAWFGQLDLLACRRFLCCMHWQWCCMRWRWMVCLQFVSTAHAPPPLPASIWAMFE